jgi:hypothetical protein
VAPVPLVGVFPGRRGGWLGGYPLGAGVAVQVASRCKACSVRAVQGDLPLRCRVVTRELAAVRPAADSNRVASTDVVVVFRLVGVAS